MIRLLTTELRRFAARRTVRVLVLAVAGLVLVGAAAGFVGADDTEPSVSSARGDLVEECVEVLGDRATCESEVPAATGFEGEVRLQDDPRFALTDLWGEDLDDDTGDEDAVLATTTLLWFLVAVVLGASFLGAEYRAGTIETVLTWEPRRLRVLCTKLVAAALGVFVLYLGLQAWLGLALAPIAVFRGTTEGADAGWYAHLATALLSGGLVVAGLAAAGGAVAVLARNTGGAIAAFFAYLISVEVIVRQLRPAWTDWYLVSNMVAVLDVVPPSADFTRTPGAGAVVLLCYLAGLVLVTALTFRLRDLG